MHEILYLFKIIIVALLMLAIYGVASMLIVPIDYGFAEWFIDTGVFLFMPVTIFLPQASMNIIDFIANIEESFGNGNGFFTVLFSFFVVLVYLAVFSYLYDILEKRDKKRYRYEI